MDNKSCIRVFADVNQIKECKKDISSKQSNFNNLSNVLGLAGNEVRFKIIYLLHKEGKMCPCDLSDVLEMTVPAISDPSLFPLGLNNPVINLTKTGFPKTNSKSDLLIEAECTFTNTSLSLCFGFSIFSNFK